MIRLIRGFDRRNFVRELDAFHKIRKHVFFDRFRWEVPIINSWEIDGYDALDPVYLLSVNESGRVVGGLRLLPTMGFNMLNDTFPQLLPEGKRIESPLIWESSRFSIDPAADIQIGPKRISRAIAELGIGMNEVGARLGLSHIVTVYDAILHRHLSRSRLRGATHRRAQAHRRLAGLCGFLRGRRRGRDGGARGQRN